MAAARRLHDSAADELEQQASDSVAPASRDDLLDVPATVVCAFCGNADCLGCTEERSRSGVISIIAWERPGSALQRLWSTAKASTMNSEAFFETLPEGPIGPALRFAVVSELVAAGAMLAVVAGSLLLAFTLLLGSLPFESDVELAAVPRRLRVHLRSRAPSRRLACGARPRPRRWRATQRRAGQRPARAPVRPLRLGMGSGPRPRGHGRAARSRRSGKGLLARACGHGAPDARGARVSTRHLPARGRPGAARAAARPTRPPSSPRSCALRSCSAPSARPSFTERYGRGKSGRRIDSAWQRTQSAAVVPAPASPAASVNVRPVPSAAAKR